MVRGNTLQEANKQYNDLKTKVKQKLELLDIARSKWENDVGDAIKKFDRETPIAIDEQKRKFDDILKSLSAKNSKCVQDKQKSFADILQYAKNYVTCSGPIGASASKGYGQLAGYSYGVLGRVEALEEQIKKCNGADGCLKLVIADIKKSSALKSLDEYTQDAKKLAEDKKKDLKTNCKVVEKYKTDGDNLIKQIKACIG
ncbi:uncharacterized protein LOC126265006 isoform X2 [Aethina tumida]|uniref:uncharacterized protein LOC126265006 isoform X2 n=1 Tax=Aethina tumida TaxID=116153 RepID=UPI002147C8D4|nr:uncharacterized protein LOC126265006 isoform X2 [Aethina tumida]